MRLPRFTPCSWRRLWRRCRASRRRRCRGCSPTSKPGWRRRRPTEQYAGALMVATQLASRAPLAPPLTEALLEGVAKGARAPLHAQALQASLALCQTQAVKALPGRAFKHLVKLPDLPGHFADLCRGYRADALAVPLVEALARARARTPTTSACWRASWRRRRSRAQRVAALAGALVAAARDAAARDAARTRSGRWSRASRQPHPPRWTLSSPSPPRRRRHPRPRRRKAPRAPPPSFCARRWRARRRARCPVTPPRSARRWTTRARVCARRRSASSARAASAARARRWRARERSPEPASPRGG